MNYEKATGKSIQEAFEQYHQANPKVYEVLKKMFYRAIKKGKKKISFKLMINYLRWEIFLDTKEETAVKVDGEPKPVIFKINDAYHSRYARLFEKEHPQYKNNINFRPLRS